MGIPKKYIVEVAAGSHCVNEGKQLSRRGQSPNNDGESEPSLTCVESRQILSNLGAGKAF